MKHLGKVTKLKILDGNPVNYFFIAGAHEIPLNNLIGQQVFLHFTGNSYCVACNRKIAKTYRQGYCFLCNRGLAQCDMCVLQPERCHYAQGTCREPEWGDKYCNIPFVVYLANTSGIKVGITKAHDMLTRWFDQGATQAVPIFRVGSRYHSGLIEVQLAKQMSDKTNWRQMLNACVEPVDLLSLRAEIFANYPDKFAFGDVEFLTEHAVKEIVYPGADYPKIKSLNFKETNIIGGTLQALKGQYMLFDTGVINIRNISGHEIEIQY
jgi:hypothetical protein